MPKLPVVKARDLIKAIEKLGFINAIKLAVMRNLNILTGEGLRSQFILEKILIAGHCVGL